jgi:hypothetical protein
LKQCDASCKVWLNLSRTNVGFSRYAASKGLPLCPIIARTLIARFIQNRCIVEHAIVYLDL